LDATVEEIRAAGGSADAAFCDIADSADVNALIAGVLERRGRIDVLVNSAVLIVYDKFLDVTDEAWDHAFEVNVTGAFYLTRAVAPSMIAAGGGGRIIHLTGSGAREVGVVSVLTGA